MTSRTETERKYEVDAVADVPPLSRIAGVAGVGDPRVVRLEAVYYDTPDLRLLRHGVTMRRRAGGADEGWHLKIPVDGDTRDELHEPLDDRPEPSESLRDLTVGLTRGAALRPVARVDTDRMVWELLGRNGKPLAEITDDSVTANALPGPATTRVWRELEVELAEGGDPKILDRVDKLVRQGGFRGSATSTKLARVLPVPRRPSATGTAGDAVLAYVSAQVTEILRHDIGIRRDAEGSVHGMRVAIRRLRSALRVFGRVVRRGQTAGLADELRWLGRRLSPARDLEVQERHFRASVAALDDELVLGPVSARLTRHFSPESASARARVLKTLASKRYRALLDDLDRLVAAPPLTERANRPAHEELPKHLRRAFHKTVRRMAAAEAGGNRDAGLHRARKAAKRFRYGVECAEPAIGKRAKRSRRNAKALTRLLGDHQDGVVARPVLRQLGARAHLAGENGFTFGLLLAQEHQRCRDVERELPELWDSFTAKKNRSWFD